MLADLRPMAGWRNKSEPMVAGRGRRKRLWSQRRL